MRSPLRPLILLYLHLVVGSALAQETQNVNAPSEEELRSYTQSAVGVLLDLPIDKLNSGQLEERSRDRLSASPDGTTVLTEAFRAEEDGDLSFSRQVMFVLASQGNGAALSNMCNAHVDRLMALSENVTQSDVLSFTIYCVLAEVAGDEVNEAWVNYAAQQKSPVWNRYLGFIVSAAFKKYAEFAEDGFPVAQYTMGAAYLHGVEPEFLESPVVEVDHARAVDYLRRSSENGNKLAAYALGKYYWQGSGSNADIAQAEKYFQMASERGHRGAKTKLERLKCIESGPQAYARQVLMAGRETLVMASSAGGRCASLANGWWRGFDRLENMYDSYDGYYSSRDTAWCDVAGSIKMETDVWSAQAGPGCR